jgi:threonine dehydratase
VFGASVKRGCERNFEMYQQHLSETIHVSEGANRLTILDVYNSKAIVIKPARVMTIKALEQVKEKFKGRHAVGVKGQ